MLLHIPPSPLFLQRFHHRNVVEQYCEELSNREKEEHTKGPLYSLSVLFQGIWVSTYIFTICFAANVGLLFGVVCTTAIVIGKLPKVRYYLFDVCSDTAAKYMVLSVTFYFCGIDSIIISCFRFRARKRILIV